MQAQDATTEYFFKLWPWLEANARRLIYGAILIVIIIFAISFYSWRQSQKEIEAGNVLTHTIVSSNGNQLAEVCLKIAADYPGTHAGERAQLQGAAALFALGNYANAQSQFQKFLQTYPDSFFVPQANLGIAASLDAQGETDLAVGAYQKAANQTSDAGVVAAAKFALAQIDKQQGKIPDAQKLYEDVARNFPNSSLGSEAGLRLVGLKMKSPAVSRPASAAPATAPFSLSH